MKRSLRLALYALTSLLVVFVLFHTPPVKETARRAVLAAIRAAADEVRLESLDYQLWRGRLVLRGLQVADASGRFFLRVPVAEAWLWTTQGVSVELDAPEIHLLESGGGASENGDPVHVQLPWVLAYLNVFVRNGAFRLGEPGQDPWLAFEGIELDLTQSPSGHEGTVAARTVAFRRDATRTTFGPLESSFELSGQHLELHRTRLVSGTSAVELRGQIGLGPVGADLDLSYRIDGERVEELVPETRLRGQLSGSGHLTVGPAGVRAETTLQSSGLSWASLGPWILEGEIRMDENVIRIASLDARGYDGEAHFEGSLGLGPGEPQSLQARWQGLNLPRLTEDWSGKPVPIADALGGEAEVELRDWDVSGVTGRAGVSLVPLNASGEGARYGLPLWGELEASAENGEISFSTVGPLRLPFAEVHFSGQLTRQHRLSAAYRARAHSLAAIDRALAAFALERPPLDLAGSLSVHGTVSGPFNELAVEARLESDDFRVSERAFNLEAALRVTGHRVHVKELVMSDAEGRLLAEGILPLSDIGPSWALQARLETFEVGWLASTFGWPFRAKVDGGLDISGPRRDPNLRANLSLQSVRLDPLPELDAEGNVRLEKVGSEIRLHDLALVWEDASLQATGTYDLATGEQHLTARSVGLQLSRVPLLASRAPELDATVAELEANLQGTLRRPTGELTLRLEDVRFRGTAFPNIDAGLHSSGETVTGTIRLDDEGELASGEVALESPYPLSVEVDLGVIPYETLFAAFPALVEADVRLSAAGTATVSAPLTDLSELRYQARVTQFVGTYRGIAGGAGAPFELSGDLDSLQIDDLDVVGAQTAILVSGTVPLAGTEVFDLQLRGDMRLELFNPALETVELAGRASMALSLAGRLTNPELRGELELEESSASISVGETLIRVEEVTASVQADAQSLALRSLEGRAFGGGFSAQGHLPLSQMSPERPARLTVQLTDLDLSRLTAGEEAPKEGTRLVVSGRGTFESPGLALESVRGSGEIQSLRTGFGALEIATDEPAAWSLEQGRLSLPRLDLHGGSTDFQVSVTASLLGEPPRYDVDARGRIDLAIFTPILRDIQGMVLTGAADVALQLTSSEGGIAMQGAGDLDGVRVTLREPPLSISNLEGHFELAGSSLVLSGLAGDVGGGRLEGKGRVEFATDLTVEQVELQASATAVRLNYPEGLRSEVDGTVSLTGGADSYLLSGDVRIVRGIYSHNISLETELLSAASRQVADLSAEETFAEKVRLQITARTDEALRIDNNLAQMQASANLTTSGTLAAPELNGVLIVEPEGRFRLGRNTYRIESGRILFNGYPLEPPELDLTARTTAGGYDILLHLSGRPGQLTTELQAPNAPELGRTDIASLLLTGRRLENVSSESRDIIGEQMALYFGGALAEIASAGLGQALPFDPVTIDPLLVGSETDPGARFTMGKSVTEDLSLAYSIGLSESDSQMWIIEYRLPRRIQLQAIRQQDNRATGVLSQRLSFDVHDRAQPARERPEASGEIYAINFRGELPIPEQELRDQIDLSAGEPYDYWEAIEEAEQIRSLLRERGYLGATVEMMSVPRSRGRTEILFRVDAGRPIEIQWLGDDPGESIKDSVRESWEGQIPESLLIVELALQANRLLYAQRYFVSEVTGKMEEDPDSGVRVARFLVSKGPRARRAVLEFEGNQRLSSEQLAQALPVTGTGEFFDLLTEKVPRLKQALRVTYASHGFLDASVGDPETRYDGNTGIFHIRIALEEGEPYDVATISIEGATAFPETRLRRELRLQEGARFRLDSYVQDRSVLAAYFRRRGFPEVSVQSHLERRENDVAVRYQIDEGERFVIGDIHIVGNRATKESVIERELTFEKGEPLQLTEITRTQQRLYELGVFRSADIRIEPVSEADSRLRDVWVEVSELPDLNVGYGLRYDTENDFEVQLNFGAPNVFGRAQHSGLTAIVSGRQTAYRATFHTPYFARYKLDTDLFLSRETDEHEIRAPETGGSLITDPLEELTWRFTFQQTRPLREQLNLQWSYSFRRALVDVLIDPTLPDFGSATVIINRSLLNTSLVGDRRDDLTRPTRGQFWSLTLQGAPAFLGSDLEFIKLFGQLFHFQRLGDRDLVWASGLRVGLSSAFGQELDETDRFKAGGPSSLRAFEQDSLMIDHPELGRLEGGESVLVMNQELRFPIYRWFRGTVFYDIGNVFRHGDLTPFELRHDAGVGLRVDLPFGLLRLDWARVLDREPGETASRFVFSLGHAF